MLLTEEQVVSRLSSLTGWSREGQWIQRRFRFSSFVDSMTFANAVGRIAEEANHHPLMAIDFKHVTLRLTTWHEGGLTELDFRQAVGCDTLYRTYEETGRLDESSARSSW